MRRRHRRDLCSNKLVEITVLVGRLSHQHACFNDDRESLKSLTLMLSRYYLPLGVVFSEGYL